MSLFSLILESVGDVFVNYFRHEELELSALPVPISKKILDIYWNWERYWVRLIMKPHSYHEAWGFMIEWAWGFMIGLSWSLGSIQTLKTTCRNCSNQFKEEMDKAYLIIFKMLWYYLDKKFQQIILIRKKIVYVLMK